MVARKSITRTSDYILISTWALLTTIASGASDDDPADAGSPQGVGERAVYGGCRYSKLSFVEAEDKE